MFHKTNFESESANLAVVAQARSSFYEFLNVHFLSVPDASFIQLLRDTCTPTMPVISAENPDLHPEVIDGWSRMQQFLEEHRDMPTEQLAEVVGIDRTRLYRGISARFGPPPPYEALWVSDGANEIDTLSRIMSVYRAAGLAPGPEFNERVDYIGTELDYLRQMASREARAWENGNLGEARDVLQKEESFLNSLNEWIPRFLTKASEFVETELYRGHMQMIKGFLAEEVEWLKGCLSDVDP